MSNPRPEEIKRVVADSLSTLAKDKALPKLSPQEELMQRVRDITDDVRRVMHPLTASEFTKQYDPRATRELVAQLYIERFSKLDKDELVFVCSLLHTEIFMETL